MKLLENRADALLFRLGRRELGLFLYVLQDYPAKRVKPPKLTNIEQTGSMKAAQMLLKESIAEHRRENARLLREFLESGKQIELVGNVFHLTVRREQVEWLLQVLNDLRVGSWERLGCPGPEESKVTEENARDHLMLDVAGAFQSALLGALDG